MVCFGSGGLAAEGTSEVKIVRQDQGFRLLRNGQPYFIKGAVGGSRLDLLAASGGNSIRAGARSLDEAQRQGLTVLVNVPIGSPRHGFDYGNTNKVQQQFENARQIVLKNKDHPALLMWALGNEMEIQTTPAQRLPVWKAVNDIAVMIHEMDGKHPVITVMGDAYRKILVEVKAHCPDIDAMGLNSYATMLTLPEDIAQQGWTQPYVITEFGPRGHWQVAKTAWGMPIEDSSTEKADFYLRAYQHAVAQQPHCLGSYVFYWSQKQEKTHTWYGMFLPDGSRTEAIDTMHYVWSGRWPANRCPRLSKDNIRIRTEMEHPAPRPNIFTAGTRLHCVVEATDPDNDPLQYAWDLRVDAAGNPNVGGDWEPPSPPIKGAISGQRANEAEVQFPQTPGKYRLFVYVYDGQGNAATANLPLLAEERRP